MQLRILVVDDSELVAAAVSRVLERAGFEVTVARSCAEARQCVWLGPFLVSIIDLELPDGSGADLADWMCREGYVCASVFHSGSSDGSAEVQQARRLGPVVPKGTPPRDLVATVATAGQGALLVASSKLEQILRQRSSRSLRAARGGPRRTSGPSAALPRGARSRRSGSPH